MIYFDNSATSKFKPRAAVTALKKEFADSANGGRAAHSDAIKTALKISDVRTFLSDYFNANEIIFTKNCTEALNIVIFGIMKSGHAITTVSEHNSVLRPLYHLKREGVIDLTVINPDKDLTVNPLHIEKTIRGDTRLVAVNAVSNVTGAAADINAIGEICAEKNILLLVDAAQAIPHIAFNMKKQNISFLAAAGHKGLHGPQGTGILALNYLNIPPLMHGGTGVNSDSVYMSRTFPESLEAGTLNSGGIIALGESAKWTVKNAKKINDRITSISRYIFYSLKSVRNVTVYTQNPDTGVISFNVGELDSSEVGNILNDNYDIAIRSGLHCAPLIHNHLGTLDRGAVRVSVGYNNSMSDAKKLIKAVREISVMI